MASLTCPSSPNSLRLRLGFRCRECSSLFLRVRFRPSNRRIVISLATDEAARSGGGECSWKGVDELPDAFAGWSHTGSGDGDSKKGGLPGMLGAGLAGILFTAGVTFAAIAVFNKNASGNKHQVDPIVMTSFDTSGKDHQVEKYFDAVQTDKDSRISNFIEDNETGTNKDFNPTNINGDVSEIRYDDMQYLETALPENVKFLGDGLEEVKGSLSPNVLEVVRDIDNVPEASCLSNSKSERPAYLDEFLYNSSKFDDLVSTTTFDTSESVTANDVSTAIHVDLNPLTSDPANLPSDSLTPDAERIDSQFSFENVAESPVSRTKDQDIEQNDLLQSPKEDCTNFHVLHDIREPVSIEKHVESDFANNEKQGLQYDSISFLQGDNLNGSSLFSAQSVSVYTDFCEKKAELKCDNESDRNPLFESPVAKSSFSHSGIPAPLLSAAEQVLPGKVLVPAVIDQVQGQAVAALQVLKVIEVDAQPGDLCTRREYARWLVCASNVFSRTTLSKVYPAMYIENLTELAFDDVKAEDPDFPFIQGLAEAGLISSKLSKSDLNGTVNAQDYVVFSPDSPVSRQDLVTWKMALERQQFPKVDKNHMCQSTGYIDVDKINPDAWPALVADFYAGEQSITALAFGYTRLFQPDKPVTKAQAAIAIATGDAAEIVGEELARIEAESLAETAVNAHNTLVAQVEKDLSASFGEELAKERQKIEDLEKLAEEARLELKRLRMQREEEKDALVKGRAAVESEMEVLSRLKHEVEEQLQGLMSNKLEISFEKDRVKKLSEDIESKSQAIVQLQYELDVERQALLMARTWAEEEAKRARANARALEEARKRWEKSGIKIVVDDDLQDDATIGTTWLTACEQPPADETIGRGERLVKKLKEMAAEMKHRSSVVIERMIQMINALISALKQKVSKASEHGTEVWDTGMSKAKSTMHELKENASEFSSLVRDSARRVVEDCKEGVGKISQKFKA